MTDEELEKDEKAQTIIALIIGIIVVLCFWYSYLHKHEYIYQYEITYEVYHPTSTETLTARGTIEHSSKTSPPKVSKGTHFWGVNLKVGYITLYEGKDDIHIVSKKVTKKYQ